VSLLEPTPLVAPKRKRVPKDPTPRFKPDISDQFDAVLGCCAMHVPPKHLARDVKAIVARLDVRCVETKRSALGRHGFDPRHVLAALIYGSLIGEHESTKLAHRMQTDNALRFVAGGHVISAGRLREFRRLNEELFRSALLQTVELASKLGLVKTDELAIDSARIRADASRAAVRTLSHSKKRLKQLHAVKVEALSETERARHEEKLRKHQETVARCEKDQVTNYIETAPSAGLLKFPSGATAPGVRLSVVAAGVKERLVLDVLIDASPNDYGKLGPIAEGLRAVLKAAHIDGTTLTVAADAGYWSEKDLLFAAQNRGWVDALVNEPEIPALRSADGTRLFSRADFTWASDGALMCPAGTPMSGPRKNGGASEFRYTGNGCPTCPLRQKCTTAKRRTVIVNTDMEKGRKAMQDRMNEPGARSRYNKRIATVEPVFSSLQDAMGFRRTTSRNPTSISAELVLKILAYNVSRITARRRLRHVRLALVPIAIQS
jgi:transposase